LVLEEGCWYALYLVARDGWRTVRGRNGAWHEGDPRRASPGEAALYRGAGAAIQEVDPMRAGGRLGNGLHRFHGTWRGE
jgi:hypothetical protein